MIEPILTDWGGPPRTSPRPGTNELSGNQESRKKEDKQYYQQDKQMGLDHEKLTGSLIGAAIAVQEALGP